MKTILKLVLTLISFSFYAQNNNYRVKYLLDFQKDSLDISDNKREIMYLDISDNRTIFQSESMFKKDSISSNSNSMGILGLTKSQFRYKIVKDTDQKSKYFIDYAATYRFYTETEEKIEWTFVNDSIKKIDKFECKLATTFFKGRYYFAWYTVDIPISSGPYKFNGLPGLILELFDSKKHYVFKLYTINKMKSLTNYLDASKFTKVSKSDLIQMEIDIKNKPSIIFNGSNLNLPMDKYDTNHRERNKKFNNPIELKD